MERKGPNADDLDLCVLRMLECTISLEAADIRNRRINFIRSLTQGGRVGCVWGGGGAVQYNKRLLFETPNTKNENWFH